MSMRRRELAIRVRFEPARTAQSNLRVAFELIIPVRRRSLRRPTSQQMEPSQMAEPAKKEQG